MAKIFKFTVTLYAQSALPRECLVHCQSKEKEIGDYRDEVFKLINIAWESSICRLGLTWPLAVTGFVLKGGLPEQQDRVLELLSAHGDDPFSTQYIPITNKLKAFWNSNFNIWDACWKEAFLPID